MSIFYKNVISVGRGFRTKYYMQSSNECSHITSERERRSNSYWWVLCTSTPKITERERKLANIFVVKMESCLLIFREKSSIKSQES